MSQEDWGQVKKNARGTLGRGKREREFYQIMCSSLVMTEPCDDLDSFNCSLEDLSIKS